MVHLQKWLEISRVKQRCKLYFILARTIMAIILAHYFVHLQHHLVEFHNNIIQSSVPRTIYPFFSLVIGKDLFMFLMKYLCIVCKGISISNWNRECQCYIQSWVHMICFSHSPCPPLCHLFPQVLDRATPELVEGGQLIGSWLSSNVSVLAIFSLTSWQPYTWSYSLLL